jgi:nitrite reductase/ring-hydroxylating ferredoxin subunit
MSDDSEQHRAQAYNGYWRKHHATPDAELTEVGPGTPCGEYMRRFWHPVALSSQLTDIPHPVRILGEDLVVFRDLRGRVGVLHRLCSHRRTSLEYGIISERGIRCCYHGWLFDIDGRILETPGESESSRIRETLCQGAYMVREIGGIVFAYMGPPEDVPEFPLLDTLKIAGNELVPYLIDYPCNWLQVAENPMDPFHSVFLHTRVTRAHFGAAWGAMPIIEWHAMPDNVGIWLTNARFWEGYIWVRVAETLLPNLAQPPDIYQNPDQEKIFPRVGITKWTVPVDDTHCQIIGWRHFGAELDLGGKGDRDKVGINSVDFLGQTGNERSYEEAVRAPSDYEAQISQGPIAEHSLETLGRTDTGVAMLRRTLRRNIRALAKGKLPLPPERNADGHVPSMAGDVILWAPRLEGREEPQAALARTIGKAIWETRLLSAQGRRRQVEASARQALQDVEQAIFE